MKESNTSSLNLKLIIPIVLGVIALIVVAVLFIFKKSPSNTETQLNKVEITPEIVQKAEEIHEVLPEMSVGEISEILVIEVPDEVDEVLNDQIDYFAERLGELDVLNDSTLIGSNEEDFIYENPDGNIVSVPRPNDDYVLPENIEEMSISDTIDWRLQNDKAFRDKYVNRFGQDALPDLEAIGIDTSEYKEYFESIKEVDTTIEDPSKVDSIEEFIPG